MFSRGIYFADRSSKSNQYVNCAVCKKGNIPLKEKCTCPVEAGEQEVAMIVSRVILGNAYLCENYYNDIACFQLQEGDLSPVQLLSQRDNTIYDSILAESKETGYDQSGLRYREVIVYDRSQCYPEFIVYYKRRHQKKDFKY